MKVLHLLTYFINSIFIKSLFISILSIMLVGNVLKTDNTNAFKIIKGLILVYAGLNISYYFIAYFSPATNVSFLGRATDYYGFVYYIMLVPNTLFPLLLLFKKLGRNKYVLLTLSFLMNLGWVIEFFIIDITALQRDYMATQLSLNFLWLILLQGLFIGSVIYAIGRAVKPKMLKTDTPTS
ncbi:hypothetical protein [Mucilaginibacter xinganensis]|uniref:Uncharacterized protein n=1 Tax=Mucilaginibacter xinganensis TaxID=1234841 RepID=A0A223P1Z5_9SPHI|nr:hypothetical protein [Mucilaginibacter xinganensis]ASU35851.1 hypothetical protein MuYL_3966 [Mucilaginibacter xinganensis]